MKKIFITAFVFFFAIGIPGSSGDEGGTAPASEVRPETKVYKAEEVMTPENVGYEDFEKYEIEDKIKSGEFQCVGGYRDREDVIICGYDRKIGEAHVEGDILYYEFDTETLELRRRGADWRDDLPEELPDGLLTAEAAAEYDVVRAITVRGGEVTSARLYYISPESQVFPLDSVAENPCRIVFIRESGACGGTVIVIIDAVTGEFLGYGSKPPQSGYYVYYIPYIAAGSGSWTGIGLLSGAYMDDANITIDIRQHNGDLLSTEKRTMAPREQYSFVVESDSPMEGWMRIISDHQLRGLGLFGTPDGYMADTSLIPGRSGMLIVPHVAQNEEWDTIIMLCNPNSTETRLNMTFYNKSGGILHILNQTLPAHGSGKFYVADLLRNPMFEGDPGSIAISSSRTAAGFVVYSNLKSGGKCHAAVTLTE